MTTSFTKIKQAFFSLGGLLLIASSIFYSSCQAQQMTQADFDAKLEKMYKKTVPLIHTEKLTENTASYLILDTRPKEEYKVSHLPNAQCAGYKEFDASMLDSVDKDQPIVVYCSVGYRSERIGEKLQKLGFTKVYNLYGGIFDWVNQDEAVVDKKEKETTKVHTYNKDWSKWLFKGEKVW